MRLVPRPRDLIRALVASLLVAAPLQAQEKVDGPPRFGVSVMAGGATVGRFLEQRMSDGSERELTAAEDVSVGAGVSYRVGEETALRASATWSPLEVEFTDDSGTGANALDRTDLADLDTYVASLEVLQFMTDTSNRLAPYFLAGVSGAAWSLDPTTSLVVGPDGGDDTRLRLGLETGAGLQARVRERLALRLEAKRHTLQNPFDGEEALRLTEGESFDEPSTTGFTQATLSVVVSF